VDSAIAYEKHAPEFLLARDKSSIGTQVTEAWAGSLNCGTEIIEIACGGGYPVTQTLTSAGLNVWAIDASPTLLAEFRSRFPGIPAQCALAQQSDYFGRKFGAAISIGLVFLLPESDQVAVMHRISEILLPSARFLFTAPIEIGTWKDVTTGHECRSLGRARYEEALAHAGFKVITTYVDEGANNYYEAEKVI